SGPARRSPAGARERRRRPYVHANTEASLAMPTEEAAPTCAARSLTTLRVRDEIASPNASAHARVILRGRVSPAGEVLPRPRAPPRGDDRLLRAAVVRTADVSRALAARADRARGRVELPGDRVEEGLPGHLGLVDREGCPLRAATCGDTGDHW